MKGLAAKSILSIVTVISLSFCLVWLLAEAAAQTKPELFQEGQQVFASHCVDCHRSNGEGLPDTFPALKGNHFVTGDPTAVVQTILAGRQGKIGRMPAWQDKLTNQQVAAVATFIRNNWGNMAEAVTAAMVAKNRKK
jgi:mono/diheme cytochrome c family protein